jgi:formate dehydrogenase major subunit
MFATDKPSCLIWAMGQTQHTVGTATVRASCILLLATGNVGGPGLGANIFRGHTNVQGATDLGLDIVTLPLYYGLVEGAWRHWSRVWEVDYEWFVDRFDKIPSPDGKETNTMNTPGIPSTRWFDATLYDKKDVKQKDNIKAMFVMGHGGNTVTRMPQAQKGIEALDLLVVADPHPTTWAALAPARKNGTYLLPIATSYETSGSRTASNRAIQWGEQIVKPIFESKDDNEVMYLLAKKLGFADQMFKNIKVENNVPIAEDVLREINRGGWSTGYCGQSPERLKSHMANQQDFDMLTQKAATGPNKGDYYGLPWPCWGTPEFKHPGTPLLYNTNLSVKEGGGTFRARFGVEREETLPDGTKRKVSLLGNGYYSKDSEIKDGYPEFTLGVLKKLGWDKDLTEAELAVIQKINPTTPDAVAWSIDLSGGIQRVSIEHGCVPYGNGKARANAFGLPDAIPTHREPIYTPKPELVAKYPTLPNAVQFRVPNVGFDVQKAAVDKGIAKSFPLILTSGRLVEYEGGGEETRSNKWLAELQQDMFIEINPADATARGIKDGAYVWVTGAELDSKTRMKALVTERVGKGVTWCPFHFAGWFQGIDQRGNYPKGTDPIVLGESVNTLTTYGFDPVTGMQEPKATLCQVRAA